MRSKTALFGTMSALVGAAALTPAISAAAADPGPTPTPPNNAVTLQAMPRGSAQFFRSMNGDLAVKLSVTGVTPGSEHSVDIERGTGPRALEPRADLARSAQVQANAGGQINQTIDLGRVATRSRGALTLTLRQGVTTNAMSAGSNQLAVQALARTQIPRQLGHRRELRQLVPVSESGTPLHGWTSYTYNANDAQSPTGQSVTVTISASGFVPRSVHAAHVHAGSCSNQGAVVVMLPDLTANANGVISVTDTVPVTQQPQGPLYVNVHEGNSNTILSNGQPTLAFRPLLCGDLNQAQSGSQPGTGAMTMSGTTSATPQPVPFSGVHS